jgi:2-dehydro-3-deoxygalactonokinase
MADSNVACIAVDWGTSNRRAWLVDFTSTVVAERADGNGLLSVNDRRFAESLTSFLEPWLPGARGRPIIIAGMAGSRLGWIEVSYIKTPAPLSDLAQQLTKAGTVGESDCWIVSGMSIEDTPQPEVMRGEECQILGALLSRDIADSFFVLPGTHSKWARVTDRRLVDFRTHMTGEVFNMLRSGGTLSQLMAGDAEDTGAFAEGVAASGRGAGLLNQLFGVRTLGLFGRLPGTALASYLSGLLVGTEMRDALRTWPELAARETLCIGSPAMIARYGACAAQIGLELHGIDNNAVLPSALAWIARQARVTGN